MAAATFDGDLDVQPGFDALDYMLEKIGRVEQDAATLRHALERATGRTRPRPAQRQPKPSGVLDAAAERLTQWCDERVPEQARHELRLEVFAAYEMVPDGEQPPTYAEVATRLQTDRTAVRNHLFAMRERIRAHLRAELRDTVSDAAELEDEWRALCG